MARDRAAREGAKPLRLFVAVEVPDTVLALVEAALVEMRERHPRGRWVPRQNQHVTMKFLGATWPRLVDGVVRAVEDVARSTPRFSTRVDGLGAFPNPRRARVLWAGLDDAQERLTAVAGALDRALEPDFTPEKRGFTPHQTIARFDPPIRLEGLPAVGSNPFSVERLVLFRSHLRRPAPVYEPVATLPLGG
jgi:2'-5' RNA ligase